MPATETLVLFTIAAIALGASTGSSNLYVLGRTTAGILIALGLRVAFEEAR